MRYRYKSTNGTFKPKECEVAYYNALNQREEYLELVKHYGTKDIEEIAELLLQEYDTEYYNSQSRSKYQNREYPYHTKRKLETITRMELPISHMSPHTLTKIGLGE